MREKEVEKKKKKGEVERKIGKQKRKRKTRERIEKMHNKITTIIFYNFYHTVLKIE